MIKHNGVIFSLLLLCGCTVGPKYHVPKSPIPVEWKSPQAPFNESENPSYSLENWWEVFNDPVLNDLERQAVKNNKDIYIALERVYQYRANAGVKGADLYPQVGLNQRYDSIGALVKIFGLPAIPGAPKTPSIIRTHFLNYVLTLSLQYELDLWGRLRSIEKSAIFEAEASEMALLSTLLIVTGDLASEYFQLRAIDAHLDLLENTIRSRREALEINVDRYHLGFINYVDVTRAESLLYNAESDFFRTARERALKENRIAVLLGIPASDFKICHNPLLELPPTIPASTPSTILAKRPDIKQAERQAASEHALINSAYASFLPDISIAGAIGSSSPTLKDFLTWKSRFWALGDIATQPVFDGYRNESNLKLAWAQFGEASLDYQKTILVAFQEVEDALSSLELEAQEMAKLERAIRSVVTTTELSTDRYYHGLSNYLDVVESERAELETKSLRTDLLGKRYVATIQLIKALGGSWNVATETYGVGCHPLN